MPPASAKHRRWLISLAVTVAALLVNVAADSQLRDGEGPVVFEVLVMIAGIAFFVGLVATVVLGAIANRQRNRESAERATAMIAAHHARQQAAALDSWHRARRLLHELASGVSIVPITVWGLVLHPGETAYLSLPADYARYYGGDGRYVHVDGVYFGSLPFVVASHAITAIGNTARRNAAIAAAAHRWREHQPTQVVLTDQRVICNVAGQWVSFYLSGLTAFYPEPSNWSAVFEFPDAAPLRLAGHSGPAIAAFVTWAVYGERGLHEHPALEPLRGDRARSS